MKSLLPKNVWLTCLCLAVATVASAQITTPRTASPAASVEQTIGISTVTIDYARPSVRDREVWGQLVPYGWNVQGFGAGNSAPWRAGANENTVIHLSHEATIQGTAVPAGSYALFFVINEDNSGEVILSKNHSSWGSYFYDQAEDQMRAPITIRDHAHTERLTYDFINIDKNSAELVLNWEKKQFPVKVEFAVDDIVMANASNQLRSVTGFNWNGPLSAARYALANNTHQEEALMWADQAIAGNRSFTTLQIKAGLLKQQGKTEEAEKITSESLAIANEAELNAYGYQLVNAGNHEKAIEILTMNTKRHPKSANVWDSLGEAYALTGDKKNAIKNFKKALSLDPPANVKANSEKYLKQFGAM